MKARIEDLKKTYDYIEVPNFDLVVLLLHYIWHQGKHGNMDAVRSYKEIKRRYNRKRWLRLNDVEALLYCANILSEEGEFWHPDGISFEEWVKQSLGRADLDRVYSYFKKDKK